MGIFDWFKVRKLIKDLDSGSTYVREQAVKELGTIGNKRAVEPLIYALRDTDLNVRITALAALGAIGFDPWSSRVIADERAVEAVIRALKDEDVYIRKGAANIIEWIGEPAVEPLIKALKDADEDIRGGAADALGKIGNERAVEPLIQALTDKDKMVRDSAVEAHGKIGDERAVEPLIRGLNDENELVRESATKALGKMGRTEIKTESKGIQILVKLFTSPNILNPSEYLDRAIKELHEEGTFGSRALANLIDELLACRSQNIKTALIVSRKVSVVQELIDTIHSVISAPETIAAPGDCPFTPEIFGAGKVGWTTGTYNEIKNLARDTLDVLSGSMTMEEIQKREAKEIDESAKLIDILEKAEKGMERLRPDMIGPIFELFGRGKYHDFTLFKAISNSGDIMIEPLRQQLFDGNQTGRRLAALALGRFHTEYVADILDEALSDPDAAVRINAANSLSKLGYVARKNVSALEDAITKENDNYDKEVMERSLEKMLIKIKQESTRDEDKNRNRQE